MCWITRKQSENSCVWTFAVEFKGETFSKNLGGELHSTCKGSQYVWKKKCFPRLIKVEKMSSLKTLQDELREVHRRKQSASNEYWVKTCLCRRRLKQFKVACNYFKCPMQSLIKTLFPSNARKNPTRFPPTVQNIGYQTARPSVPVGMCAFPN